MARNLSFGSASSAAAAALKAAASLGRNADDGDDEQDQQPTPTVAADQPTSLSSSSKFQARRTKSAHLAPAHVPHRGGGGGGGHNVRQLIQRSFSNGSAKLRRGTTEAPGDDEERIPLTPHRQPRQHGVKSFPKSLGDRVLLDEDDDVPTEEEDATEQHDTSESEECCDYDESASMAEASMTPVVVLKKPNNRSTSRRTLQTEVSSSSHSDNDGDDDDNDIERQNRRLRIHIHSDTRSTRSLQTNRTLAEIRRAKLEKEQPASFRENSTTTPTTTRRPILCCGLSKCGWCGILVLATVGFLIGFLVPLVQTHQTASSASTTNQDSGPTDDDTGTPVYIPLTPDDDESLFNETGPFDETSTTTSTTTSAPTTPPLEPPVDVWNLFHLTAGNSRMPVASHTSLTAANNQDSFYEPHLQQAAQHFVQKTLHTNLRRPLLRITNEPTFPKTSEAQTSSDYAIPFVDTPLVEYDAAMPYPTGPSSSSSNNNQVPHGDVSQWEALLKAAGVHAADSLQFDTSHNLLYVGHGQHIDIVDTLVGQVRTTIQLPQPAQTSHDSRLRDSWLLPVASDRQDDDEEEWTPAPPTPFIEQLLLTSDGHHLVVIVSDYTSVHTSRVKPLLQESLVTHLWTYQLTHNPDDSPVVTTTYELLPNGNGQEDGAAPHVVHGRVLYAAQATSNRHIHIVTSSRIDTNRLLRDPLERLYYPDDRHDSVYAEQVIQAAQTKYIPLYAKRLVREIQAMANRDENNLTLWPLTQWISGIDDSSVLSESERHMQQLLLAQEHLQELIVVTSLSLVHTKAAAAATTTTTATTTRASSNGGASTAAFSTAFIGPASVDVIGSTATQLTLSVPGYQWTTSNSSSSSQKVLQEATHILNLELGTIAVEEGTSYRAATRFQSLGAVPGRLVQSARQSTEIRGQDLRLATVVTKQWNLAVIQGETMVQEVARQKSYMNVVDVQSLQPKRGSPLALWDGEPGLVSAVSFLEKVAYVFPLEPLSMTANKTSTQVVDLGVVDKNPVAHVAGSIIDSNIQGFSPFLHELDSPESGNTQKLLVSMGENKTAVGSTMGYVFSVWDATDPAQLKPLVQYSLESPQMLTTWKPQTFRVTTQGQVILPITTEFVGGATLDGEASEQANMNGFVVLDVSPTEVKERARVTHSPVVAGSSECVPGASDCLLEARSFLGSDNTGDRNYNTLLTLQGNVARSTILGEQEDTEEWTLGLH